MRRYIIFPTDHKELGVIVILAENDEEAKEKFNKFNSYLWEINPLSSDAKSRWKAYSAAWDAARDAAEEIE